MFKNDPDKSIDMLASGGAAVLANDGAATGCVEATEAEAAVASKPLDEKSDNRGYGNVSAGVGDEVGVGIAEGAARPLRSVPAKSFGYRFVKRVFDIGFSLCVIVIGFVPVALLCLIIRLESPGSPIYFQKRVGRYGTSLSILKLRTMVADSDDVEKYLSPEQLAQWKSERKVDCDPRVTRVGALLRKTSLDELPQFLNVLAGSMSVVGPRPVVEDELVAYGDDLRAFLSAKPGITGWWQVQARNDAAYEDGSRQELELYYVQHASLILDARVIAGTVCSIFKGTGK